MSEESKVESLASDLRQRIARGEFGTSGRIPSVVQMARDWKTTRSTVYAALQLLQSEGALTTKGNALVANYPRLRIPGITPTFDRYLIEHDMVPLMENLVEPSIVPMPADVAQMFNQQEGVLVVHRMRRQGTTDTPFRIAENYYPASLAGQFVDAMRANSNLDVLSEIKRVHNLSIVNVHEDVLARIPTQQEAQLLNIVRTAPVLEVRRSNFAADGTPIMFNKIIFVGAFFLLSYDYSPDHWSK